MVLRVVKTLILGGLVILGQTGVADQDTEPLALNVGEVRMLPGSPDQNAEVSRKGIVEVSHSGVGWKIIALKPGFVLVDLFGEGGSVHRKRYLVTVSLAPKAHRLGEGEAAWFCGELHCHPNGKVSGEATDYIAFFLARQSCAKANGCAFTARLSTQALDAWLNHMRWVLGAVVDVRAQSTGDALILLSCDPSPNVKDSKGDRNLAMELAKNLPYRNFLTFACASSHEPRMYHVKAKIIVVEDADFNEIGMDDPRVSAEWLGNMFRVGHLFHFAMSGRERNFRVIGEPNFVARSGSHGRAQAGGEIFVGKGSYRRQEIGEHDRSPQGVWKEYGLDFSLRVSPLTTGRVVADLKFSFKLPSSDDRKDLKVQALESVSTVELGKPSLLGRLQFQQEGREKRHIPVLGSIPVIGPLFQLVQTEKGATHMLVCALLTEAEG